jgi:hypothetical protein
MSSALKSQIISACSRLHLANILQRLEGRLHSIAKEAIEFRDGKAADAGVGGIEGEVIEIVGTGIQGGKGEPGDARDEGEPNVLDVVLYRGVKVMKHLAVGLGQRLIVDMPGHWDVILVHQDHCLGPTFFRKPDDELLHDFVEELGVNRYCLRFGHGHQIIGYIPLKFVRALASGVVHPEPDDGVSPEIVIRFRGIYPQSLEKVSASQEQILDGVLQKRLAETPWPGEEATGGGWLDHFADVGGFVGVEEIVRDYFAESRI